MTTVLVTFNDLWLCDVTDPSVTVHASYPKDARTAHLDGDFRSYAGGRVRIITTPADARTHPITLQWLTPDTAANVRAVHVPGRPRDRLMRRAPWH